MSSLKLSQKTGVILLLVVAVYLQSSATIINIPDDYATIQAGIDASNNGDTVLVQPGTYVENINFNGHNIVLGSLFLTTGDTSYISQTVIDGNSSGSVVETHSGEDSTTIITGFNIQNGHFGIYCHLSSTTIINNNINNTNNGIHIYSSRCVVKNNSITNNTDGICNIGNIQCLIIENIIYNNSGWGIYCDELTNSAIINNTIYGNENGGFYGWGSNAIITNTIFRNNSDNEIELLGGSPSITYCNIQDTLWPGEGNIDVDPLFRDPDNWDFHLMAIECGDSVDSPCIDTGHPALIDSLLNCEWGLGTVLSDMGAYGGGASAEVDISNLIEQLPRQIALHQNYPNPFNATTNISFEIANSGNVELVVYDLLGRKVGTLVNEQRQAGYYQAIWNAQDFSSGIYFYKIRSNDFSQTKKCVLLK